MDNVIQTIDNITKTLTPIVNNDISAQTYDLIQKIKNSSTPIGTTANLTEFISNGTWTLPANKPKFVYILMVGAGGGGAGSRTSGYGAAGGGGGGIVERLLTDINGDITVTIGAKGAPGGSNAVGADGGDTTISYIDTNGNTITLTAYGGKGGQGENIGAGGAGDYYGGNGAPGALNNGVSGDAGKYGLGNGGGSGSDFNGNKMPGGAGNNGSLSYQNATANTGCGGGGAGYTSNGGYGADGYCKIIYWN